MIPNLKLVSNLLFGEESFKQINRILKTKRKKKNPCIVFLVDNVFKNTYIEKQIPVHITDILLWANVTEEPKTSYVDKLTNIIKKNTSINKNNNPSGIVGIGGGSTMDLAKAISVMLTNDGKSEDYQGWDLIKKPGIYHMAIPTLSGTGSEVSRTSVLIGPKKKLGINSDYVVFDQIILDPKMTTTVPKTQRFYTGMDCYIHCVESLNGTYSNTFSRAYGEKAKKLCRDIFLNNSDNVNKKLMVASYFGGMSITYSQVGVCHAMSYGLSFVTGIKHGLSNCIIFNLLKDFYPDEVNEFHKMLKKQNILLPNKVTSSLSKNEINKMIDVAITLEPLWENALGKKWKNQITRNYLEKMYLSL